MPTIIGLSWLTIPTNYIFDESGNQMVGATIFTGALIGFGQGRYLAYQGDKLNNSQRIHPIPYL